MQAITFGQQSNATEYVENGCVQVIRTVAVKEVEKVEVEEVKIEKSIQNRINYAKQQIKKAVILKALNRREFEEKIAKLRNLEAYVLENISRFYTSEHSKIKPLFESIQGELDYCFNILNSSCISDMYTTQALECEKKSRQEKLDKVYNRI